MFRHRTYIHLRDTDATGVLYFPSQFQLVSETLEAFLRARNFPLDKLFQSAYLLPVVHAEADYLAPVTVNTQLDIFLKRGPFGNSSLTLFYEFFEAVATPPAREKSMILTNPCQNPHAGSVSGGDDILEKVDKPPLAQGASKGRFCAAGSVATASNDNRKVGTAKIIHVVTDRKTGKSCPIPDELRQLFEGLDDSA